MNLLLSTLLILSLILNLLVIRYDMFPFLYPKIKRKYFASKMTFRNLKTLETLIVDKSIESIGRKKSLMIWREPNSISERLYYAVFTKENSDFWNINFPRTFLIKGVTEYLLKFNDSKFKTILPLIFDELIDSVGIAKFSFDKVDQVPLGLVSLKLFEELKEEKYLLFCQRVFSFLENNYDKNENVVLYRSKSEIVYYDTIGMIVPFLVEYYKLCEVQKAREIAYNQVKYYINFGINTQTYIPSHAIHIRSGIQLGSINWGRGIGWYFIGLKMMYELDGNFKKEYFGLSDTLMKLRNKEGLWSQFPGSDEIFDASTTTMFLYCLPKEYFTKEEILTKLNKYISKDGFILQTSGDTYGANNYSKTFGKSELSQGMLMSVLSRYN